MDRGKNELLKRDLNNKCELVPFCEIWQNVSPLPSIHPKNLLGNLYLKSRRALNMIIFMVIVMTITTSIPISTSLIHRSRTQPLLTIGYLILKLGIVIIMEDLSMLVGI